MKAITAVHPPVARTVIRSLQSASDPAGIRLSLIPPTELEGADAMSHHDGVFEEAGRRGMAHELLIGLIEYACKDARKIPANPTRSTSNFVEGPDGIPEVYFGSVFPVRRLLW